MSDPGSVHPGQEKRLTAWPEVNSMMGVARAERDAARQDWSDALDQNRRREVECDALHLRATTAEAARDAAQQENERFRQALALCDECRGNVVAVLCADCYRRGALAAALGGVPEDQPATED